MRFALFARVSTSTQETDGVSLDVQKQILLDCIKKANGTCVKEYMGSESATAGDKQRPLIDKMLMDAKNKEFDALIVYDMSRLTRDPITSKIILAELKKNNIALYVQNQVYKLDNPETNLIVNILSEINAFSSSIQIGKSIESKIALAKKGWLMFGHYPFGRKLQHNDYSKEPVWIIDEEGFKKAQEIYDYYINQNIYVDKLAKMINFSRHTIYKILKDDGVFVQNLEYEGKQYEFKVEIPTLFTEEQRAIIKQRLKKNKKNNGNKYDYLLSGYVKCEVCKLHHVGLRATNTGSKYPIFYYRHSLTAFHDGCAKHVPLKKLNEIVLENIIEIVSNTETLLKIITESNQLSFNQKQQLEKRKEIIQENLDKDEKGLQNLIRLVVKGILSDEDIEKQSKELKQHIDDYKKDLITIDVELSSLSSLDIPENTLNKIQYILGCFENEYGCYVQDWPFKAQRSLVEWFFGYDESNGVYVKRDGKDFVYTIQSNLGTVAFGSLSEGCCGVAGYPVPELGESGLAGFRSALHDVYMPKLYDVHEQAFAYRKITIEFVGKFMAPKSGPKR